MLLKQLQLFRFEDTNCFVLENLLQKLEQLSFNSCLPSTSYSAGWVSPIDENDMPLAISINGKIILCLQIEEKILPASVVQQELRDKIKEIAEQDQGRKVYKKEKQSLKDEIIMTLLPNAFSKLTRIFAYIDPQNHWLVLGTINAKKTEQFIDIFKKSISDAIAVFELKKIPLIMTDWIRHKNYPTSFSIEKACVLQDPKQQSRIIRCQQQDIFANGIQTLIKEGCEIIQIALQWQDHLQFTFSHKFQLQGIRFGEDIIAEAKDMEAETQLQQFTADFFIMSQSLSQLLNELLNIFAEMDKVKSQQPNNTVHQQDTSFAKLEALTE